VKFLKFSIIILFLLSLLSAGVTSYVSALRENEKSKRIELEAKIKDLKAKIEGLNEEKKGLEDELTQNEAQINDLNAKIEAERSARLKATQIASDQEKQANSVREELRESEKSFDNAQRRNRELEKILNELQKRLKEAEDRAEKAMNQVAELNAIVSNNPPVAGSVLPINPTFSSDQGEAKPRFFLHKIVTRGTKEKKEEGLLPVKKEVQGEKEPVKTGSRMVQDLKGGIQPAKVIEPVSKPSPAILSQPSLVSKTIPVIPKANILSTAQSKEPAKEVVHKKEITQTKSEKSEGKKAGAIRRVFSKIFGRSEKKEEEKNYTEKKVTDVVANSQELNGKFGDVVSAAAKKEPSLEPSKGNVPAFPRSGMVGAIPRSEPVQRHVLPSIPGFGRGVKKESSDQTEALAQPKSVASGKQTATIPQTSAEYKPKGIEQESKKTESLYPSQTSQIDSKNGRVLLVNRQFNFIVNNLGSKHGVGLNDVLSVMRRGGEIAKVRVEKIYDDYSAAYITEEQDGIEIGEGDEVSRI